MMLILRDDLVLETFESPECPPGRIEWIDVENNEYESGGVDYPKGTSRRLPPFEVSPNCHEKQ